MSLIRLSRRACGKLRLLRRGARAYSDDANPIAKHIFPTPAAKTAASEPAATNTWLLHPWLPIDVRWLTALGAGLAAAYWMGQEYLPEGVSLPQLPQLQQLPELKLPPMPTLPWNKAQAPPPPPQEVILTEGKDGLEARPSPSPETSGPVPTAEEPGSESAIPLAPLVDKADGGSTATAAAEPEEQPEEPEVVDPVPVQDLINEVLAGTSYTAPVVPAGEQPSLEGGEAVAAVEEGTLEAEAPRPGPPSATSVEELEQQLEALRAPIPGEAGVTDEEAAAHRQRPEVIRSKGLLGMADNITTADLVEQAVQHGLGSKDWAAFEAAHRQAVADARTFRDILRRAQDYHQEELASAYSVAERWAQRADETMTKAEENIELFRGLLQYQRRLAEQHVKEYELELQRSSLFKEHAQMLVRERSNRMMLLEAVRKEVNVVSATLDSVGQRLKDGAASSRIRTGLHVLLDRAEAGQPFQDQLAQLQRAAQHDPLLQAALASIPADLAQEGLRTPGQLQEGWSSIKSAVQLNGILPEGGGVLSLLVARLAAALKLSERRYVELGMGSTSHNTCVAAVERHVMEGRFRAAALELEELLGPGAVVPGSAVHRWIKAAKSRALLDQAVTLLKAHATALSTSVA